MTSLVAIPWQPTYKLTPVTLERLQRASAIAGHNIRVDDAWRSYNEQLYYRQFYEEDPKNHPYAGDPDDTRDPRNHQRGAAVDIVNSADRAAMLAAGFTADPVEWWHFNDPNAANMPIIMSDTSTASNNATIIESDDDMAAGMCAIDSKGTVWHLTDDGGMTSLATMSQVDSLIMTNAIRKVRPEASSSRAQYTIPMSQDAIDRRKEIAARRKVQN